MTSQQDRAFAAVIELNERLDLSNESLSGASIAVIGSGACGLTVAATAGYLGANVHVFDKDGLLGGAHKSSEHRFLHPNFYNWPFEDECPVSDLPFLNWVTDTGKSVAQQIIKDWEFIMSELPANISTPTRQADLKEINGRPGAWTLKFKQKLVRTLPKFDHVFLCMGFGDDGKKFLKKKSPPYWSTRSHMVHYRIQPDDFRDQALERDAKLYVFGNGDGGINECLQFIYKDFLPGDPQPKLLNFLKVTGIADELKKIETAADSQLRALDLETPSARGNEWRKLGDQVWWDYVKIIRGFENLPLYSDCFGPSNQNALNTACLVGHSATPFDINATAINRVILCISVLSGAVTYHRSVDVVEGRGRGKHKVSTMTSRNGWTEKIRLVKAELEIDSRDYRTARFGPGNAHEHLKINGHPVKTDEVRRNQVRLVEQRYRRKRDEFEPILVDQKSRFQNRHIANTYAEAFNDKLAQRFRGGFEKLYLTPEPSLDGETIYTLSFKFAGAVRDQEKASWERVLPTQIFGKTIKHNDLDLEPPEEIE